MIEIKSRYDGRVLYTAETASDVRAAVIEAVKSGANLSRANLSRANLSRANLSRANLSRANLCGADLSGANLYGADLSGANLSGANLCGANLCGADLSRADLSRADLSGADLYGANLSRANLCGANLSGADLYGADLYGADLYRAKGVNKHLTTPLYMLLEQTGKIRAYKLVDSGYRSPIRATGRITYTIGETVEVPNASNDEHDHCAAGVNVATLDWCMREWRKGYRILVVEFTRKDIACIPVASDGKFRLHRCKVIAEKDLTELGLITAETVA